MRTLGGAILTKRERKDLLQVLGLSLKQKKKVYLLHQGCGYTLQEMIEKSLEIIRSSVTKHVKYLTPLFSVFNVQRKSRDALEVTRVSIFEVSRRGGPPPALVGLWHLCLDIFL